MMTEIIIAVALALGIGLTGGVMFATWMCAYKMKQMSQAAEHFALQSDALRTERDDLWDELQWKGQEDD